MRTVLVLCVVIACLQKGVTCEYDNGEILWDILNECFNGIEPMSRCLKLKVLRYFDGSDAATVPRASDKDSVVDRMLVKRFRRYLNARQFELQLPEFLFGGAALLFKPGKDMADFEIKLPKTDDAARHVESGRDAMQVKMLLPLLLLLKMKMKMITPIMLSLVSMKATKALVMSKLALLLVVGFLATQIFKKLGMHLPMLHPAAEPMSMMTSPPPFGGHSYGPPTYGPPTFEPPGPFGSPTYGPPSYGPPMPAAPPQSSQYNEPETNSWEPSSSANSYSNSRMWDPQQMAYKAYVANSMNQINDNNNNAQSSNSQHKV